MTRKIVKLPTLLTALQELTKQQQLLSTLD